ncbi:hypothetical protein ACFE04_028200 [Oxalis oulophora]
MPILPRDRPFDEWLARSPSKSGVAIYVLHAPILPLEAHGVQDDGPIRMKAISDLFHNNEESRVYNRSLQWTRYVGNWDIRRRGSKVIIVWMIQSKWTMILIPQSCKLEGGIFIPEPRVELTCMHETHDKDSYNVTRRDGQDNNRSGIVSP